MMAATEKKLLKLKARSRELLNIIVNNRVCPVCGHLSMTQDEYDILFGFGLNKIIEIERLAKDGKDRQDGIQ